MTIENYYGALYVYSNIYFDRHDHFCDRPYVYLLAYKDAMRDWEEYSIAIGIFHRGENVVSLLYKTDKKHFEDVLHELINWMCDHEHGITNYDDIFDEMNFFPDCGCERHVW